MNPRRVGVLLFRELLQGPKDFIFVFAVVVPIVMSFAVSLVFGSLFSEKPRLGIADAGNSQFTRSAVATGAFTVQAYASEAGVRNATATGRVHIGVALPQDFDERVRAGSPTTMVAYIWGESLLQDRAALATAMSVWVRQIAGQESSVDIETTVLGDPIVLPWEDRLLPFVIIMGVTFGGLMIPASSLVAEKQRHTLMALAVTPTTMGDIYIAKGLVGVIVSTGMGLLILALNRALGGHTALLAGVLLLGAIFAAESGVLLGMLVADINSLFATVKILGLLLYAPALIYMFPEIPQWIARIFPTYYVIQPVIEISQHGAELSDVAWQLGILLILIVGLVVLLGVLSQRLRYRE
jgi:ABC-2 type transport system permease protein